MTPRRLRAIAFAAVIVAVAVSVVLFRSALRRDERVIFDYIPRTTTLVAGVDMSRLRASRLAATWSAPSGFVSPADDIASVAGAAWNNLDQLLIAGVSLPDGSSGLLSVGRGPGLRARVNAALARDETHTESYGQWRFWIVERSNTRTSPLAVAMPASDVVVVGRLPVLRSAIELFRERRDDVVSAAQSASESTLWALARADAVPGAARVLLDQNALMGWITLTADVTDVVRGVVRGRARDAAAAVRIRDTIRGIAAVGRAARRGIL